MCVFVNKTDFVIGAHSTTLPPSVSNNQCLINLVNSRQTGKAYRCLALLNTNNERGLEREVQHLLDTYSRELGQVGANGVTLHDLDAAERLFCINIQVYSLVRVEHDVRSTVEELNSEDDRQ